ncbi:MAG: hypothetical protein HC921_07270 [Synechococcaceae cyanobacterium SM2_3_1]|nr:hypothetical protein [Synechococcaceae cyanobacterium SM2_3_1]
MQLYLQSFLVTSVTLLILSSFPAALIWTLNQPAPSTGAPMEQAHHYDFGRYHVSPNDMARILRGFNALKGS